MKEIAGLMLLAAWLVGVVLAHGFLSTLAAVLFPFWAWFLVAERIVWRYL